MRTDPLQFKKITGKAPVKKPTETEVLLQALKSLESALKELPAPVVNVPPITIPKWDVQIPVQPQQVAPQVVLPPLRRWIFDVERDSEGRLKRIIATPQ